MSIKNILENANSERDLVAIYINSEDWSKCSVGYVDQVNDYFVRLKSVSQYGSDCGYEIRSLSDVYKVERGGKYENKIKILRESQQKVFSEINLADSSSENFLIDALTQAKTTKVIVVLFGKDYDDSLVGYVEDINNLTVSLQLIDEYGENDGEATINLDEIDHLDFNTHSEQVRRFLNKKLKDS